MNNNISELLKSHCSIFGSNLQNVKLPLGTDKSVQGIFQLDYLLFNSLNQIKELNKIESCHLVHTN